MVVLGAVRVVEAVGVGASAAGREGGQLVLLGVEGEEGVIGEAVT